jgi:hypothetical protein
MPLPAVPRGTALPAESRASIAPTVTLESETGMTAV